MTNYAEQLINCAKESKTAIPNRIYASIGDKLEKTVTTRGGDFPPSFAIIAKSVDHRKYEHVKHFINIRESGWQFKVMLATEKKSGFGVFIVILKKEGTSQFKRPSKEKKHGNNSKKGNKV